MSARSAPTPIRPTLDEMVDVTFTVSPRVRRIAAHNPDELPLPEYYRQMYWGSGVDLPGGGLRGAGRRFHHRPCRACAGRKRRAVDPASGRVHHRLRAGHAFGAVHRRQGRADARAPEPVADLRPRAHAQPDAGDAARAAAPGAGEPHRHARAAERLHRRQHAARPARQAPALPHGQAAALQPDVPRPLPDRHAGRRTSG